MTNEREATDAVENSIAREGGGARRSGKQLGPRGALLVAALAFACGTTSGPTGHGDGGPTDGGAIGAECSSDNECASGRRCVNQVCAGCSTSADCSAGYICSGHDCTLACASHTDCPAGEACLDGACGACVTSADCGDPSVVCLGGSCLHCRKGADCPAGLACLANGCGACAADHDCDSGNLCIGGACKPGACKDKSGCPATQVCNAQTLSCTTCTLDAQCAAGRICVSGVCEPGDCHSTADCPSGEACIGASCGACTAGSQCARASNSDFVCDNGACAAGNCASGADCTGASAHDACIGHICTACSTSAECGSPNSGLVCVSGKCASGDCAIDVACPNGALCEANVCTRCTQSSDCLAGGVVCVSGSCVAGECAQESECNGLICNASHQCVNCASTSDCTAAGLANTVCDTGKCVSGVCTAATVQSDCKSGSSYDGLACVQNQCIHCTASSQCPAGDGCFGATGATLCQPGNCSANSDCTPTLGSSPATLSMPFCDQGTHTCAPCTASNECPSNYVCNAASAGECVRGNCSFDEGCAAVGPSFSCVNNACVQLAPAALDGGAGASAAESSAQFGSQPSVLSGALGLYYSYGEGSGSGQHQVALDATNLTHVRWQATEAIAGTTTFAGIVIPASGFTGGELFLTGSASNNGVSYAHDGQTGEVMWTMPTESQAALGIAGTGASARLTVAVGWYNSAGPYRLFLTGADGTNGRAINMPCSLTTAPAFGKYLVYFLCYTGLSAVDPVLNKVAFTVPFPGGNSCNDAAPAVWRSDSSATSETVYFASGTSGCGNDFTEYWVNVTDAVAQSGGALAPAALNKGPTVQVSVSGYSATMLDSNDLAGGQPPRVVFAHGGGGVAATVSITDGAGTLLAKVSTPFTSGMVSLAGDGTLIGINGATNNNGLLTGIRITPNAATPTSAAITTRFAVPLAPAGNWQTFAYPTVVGTPGPTLGNLLAWAQPGGLSAPELIQLKPGAGSPSFLPPQPPVSSPSWSWFGGDPGAHRSVANFDCSTNADCGSTQSCILNRCIGTCQTPAQCGNQEGCVMGQCEACVADASCPANNRCSGGLCWPSGTCSVNSDCSSNQFCVHASCVPATQQLTSIQSTWNGGGFAVGTDGSLYSFLESSGLNIQAWNTSTLDGPTLTALSTWPAMNLTAIGPYGGVSPTIVRVGSNAYDTLFLSSYQPGLAAIPGVGATSAGGANYVLHNTVDDVTGSAFLLGPLAQGVSTILDGSTPLPTFFSYGSNRIYGFDVAQAAAGVTGSGGAGALHAVWSAATGCPPAGCVDNLGPSPVPLLVGSDGTLYHFRTNGEIQAWDPNGDRSSPPTGLTYAGKLLWTFTAPTPWTDNVGTHPAIFKAAGHDVLYFCTNIANTVALLNVSASGSSGYLQTTAPCGNGRLAPLVVDASGYLLVSGNNTLTLMAPNGDIASQINYVSNLSSSNITLGDDGIAYLVAPGPLGQELTAVQLTPSHTLVTLWQVTAAGNTLFDASSVPLLYPGTPAHLLADYPANGPRDWASFSLGTTHTPLAGAWSMQGGDYQHRNSLKTH